MTPSDGTAPGPERTEVSEEDVAAGTPGAPESSPIPGDDNKIDLDEEVQRGNDELGGRDPGSAEDLGGPDFPAATHP